MEKKNQNYIYIIKTEKPLKTRCINNLEIEIIDPVKIKNIKSGLSCIHKFLFNVYKHMDLMIYPFIVLAYLKLFYGFVTSNDSSERFVANALITILSLILSCLYSKMFTSFVVSVFKPKTQIKFIFTRIRDLFLLLLSLILTCMSLSYIVSSFSLPKIENTINYLGWTSFVIFFADRVYIHIRRVIFHHE